MTTDGSTSSERALALLMIGHHLSISGDATHGDLAIQILTKLISLGAHRPCAMPPEGGYRSSSSNYSALMLAALMIGVQRAISLLTRTASGCWPRFDLAGMSQPRPSRRLRTLSSSSALSSASVSVSRTAFGVPLGANKAFQADASNSGKPASFDVGTFGRLGLRSAVLIA